MEKTTVYDKAKWTREDRSNYRLAKNTVNVLLDTAHRPVARNFNRVVLLYKIVDLFNKIVDSLTNLCFFQTK